MFPLLVWELVHQTINCIGYFTIENWIVNECPGGNLIWARMSGVVIWCEHECPGWSFNVSTNVRGGHLMWARMSGPVKNRVGTNVRGNECPYTLVDLYFNDDNWTSILLQTGYIDTCFYELHVVVVHVLCIDFFAITIRNKLFMQFWKPSILFVSFILKPLLCMYSE